jgi:hypothetical protein
MPPPPISTTPYPSLPNTPLSEAGDPEREGLWWLDDPRFADRFRK